MVRFDALWRGLQRAAKTRYPRFIAGLAPPSGEIPVFTYHDVTADAFARDLEFLRTNGYRTLNLDEFLAVRAGRYPPPPRAVLLTFDDARASFHSVALPLLRAFEARATLFVPTYWMDASPATCGDVQFMSWAQVRECVESGRVDVQSHAHRHALVPVAPHLVGFATPAALRHFDIYDWPMRTTSQGEALGRPALGTPIYRAEPLLSAHTRYLENEALSEACREYVRSRGGETFFSRRIWRSELLGEYRRRARSLPGVQMGTAEIEPMIASEFELTRARFQTELGYAPRVIAYPWMLGSRTSLEHARRHGFEAAFGVALDFRSEQRHDAPIRTFGRYKCDWLRFLPGEQRASVLATLGDKLRGFAAAQHLAH